MDDFLEAGAAGGPGDGPRRAEPPPPVLWRFVAVPLLFVSVVAVFALFSYEAADVAAVQAPPSRVAANWMGRLGAHLAWGTLLFFGLVGFLLPFATGAVALLMLCGRHLRWRPLWLLGLVLSLCALAQFLNGTFEPLLASDRLCIAPNAGGGVGYLFNHPGSPVLEWLGTPGAAVLYGALALLFLLLTVGFGNVAAAIRARRARRERLIEAAEDLAIGSRTELDADDLARADARREALERRRAEREARQAERDRAELAAADERAKRREEKRAEKERRREEKRAEKERRRAERDARRRAKEEGVDDLVAGGLAPAVPPAPVRLSSAPAAPAPAARGATPRPAPTAVPPPDLSDGDEAGEPPPHVDFELPPTRLLHPLPPETAFDNRAEIAERSRVIEDTLAEFGLPGAVTHVVSGPTITRYEVKPEAGVKVDRIQGVHRNLQMNLRAKSLRIVAPIPGKDVVGIEVPNIKSRPVPLRGIAESPEWKEAAAKMALPMLLSRDIDGQPVIADLAKMPHMIVAGTTGSGKSVTLNGILAGWLLTRTPDQLRLVLVDPKRVEFTPYADIPHLVVPVITEAPKVAVCLQWAVKEMDKRLKLFQKTGVRNISAYNSRPRERQGLLFGGEEETPDRPDTLPYIAIVIDEMSDLMMLAGADVEPRVVRLAQLARAVGIHLIIATQRPDVKVITGKIKANFPARIALKVSSAVDSITIVDQGGAQSLIGRGDMLFLNPTSSAGLQRSQSCWIDDDEIAALTQWYRDQSGPLYLSDIKAKLDKIKIKDAGDEFKTFEADDAGAGEGGGEEAEGADGETAFLQKCLDTLVAADRASTSMLQRKLRLGYNKAARVIDQLEQLGCLGPANGAAPREILRTTVRDPSAGADGVVVPDDG